LHKLANTGYKPGVSSRIEDSDDSLQALASVIESTGVLCGAGFDANAAKGLALSHNWFNSAPGGGELMYL